MRGSISRCQPHPTPSAPQFYGSLLFMRTPFDEFDKFDMVTRTGMGLVLGVNHVPVPKGRSPSAPQFLGFSISMTTCVHPLTQNDQIRHGSTYGGGTYFRGQPRH